MVYVCFNEYIFSNYINLTQLPPCTIYLLSSYSEPSLSQPICLEEECNVILLPCSCFMASSPKILAKLSEIDNDLQQSFAKRAFFRVSLKLFESQVSLTLSLSHTHTDFFSLIINLKLRMQLG